MGKLIGIAAGVGAAVAGIGVVVAAAVPSLDLFGLYAAREKTAVVAPALAKKPETPVVKPVAPPAPAPVPAIDPNARIPDEWTTVDDPRATELVPSADPGEEPASSATSTDDPKPPAPQQRPAPRPSNEERSLERDISFLRELKPAAQLPALTDTGDTTLSYLNDAEKLRFNDVAVLAGVAALGDGGQFKLKRDGSKPRWTILLQAGSPAVVPEGDNDAPAEAIPSEDESAAEAPEAEAPAEAPAEETPKEEAVPDPTSEFDMPPEEKTTTKAAAKIAFNLPAETPIAELWCVESSLMFRWLPAAKDNPLAEQLRNTAVRFSLGTHHQLLVLREALTQPVYTLDLADRTKEIACTIEHPPRAELLYLEVIDVQDMPVNAYYLNEEKTTAIPAAKAAPPAEEKKKPVATPKPKPGSAPAKDPTPRVTVLFDKLVDGEQPQIWVEPRLENGQELKIRVAPRIVRGNIVDDLTSKSLELYRVPRDQRLASVERDWKNAHDATVALDRRIGETRAGINPSASIRALQSKLEAARREHKKLDDELNRIKAELAWVDAANLLIKSIDNNGQIKYRVFAKSGDLEIDLIRAGVE
jgi:hypothetical protein